MNQTFWMARSQTHNDHDASQSFSAFFSFSQYFFGHLPIFLRKPEVERLVNPDFLESNTISRWYQRIFSVSHPPGGILGFILWAVVINHSALKKCNFIFFTLLKEEYELPSLRPYDALVPFRIITKERARFIITILKRNYIIKIVKIIKIN